MGFNDDLGRRLKAARKAAKLTQEQVARHFAMARPSVSSWETGDTLPELGKLPGLGNLLNVSLDWLLAERGAMRPGEDAVVPVVGYVGAGAEIFPFDEGPGARLDERPAPPGLEDAVAVIVRSDSMWPVYREGDVLFYRRNQEGVPPDAIGEDCIVKVLDGPTLVKTVRPGRGRTFTLESYNAPPRPDQKVEWAARILFVDKTKLRRR